MQQPPAKKKKNTLTNPITHNSTTPARSNGAAESTDNWNHALHTVNLFQQTQPLQAHQTPNDKKQAQKRQHRHHDNKRLSCILILILPCQEQRKAVDRRRKWYEKAAGT